MHVGRWLRVWAFVALGLTTAQAEVPAQLYYQGRLARDGQPVTAAVPLAFRLFDADQGGVELFAETQTVDVVDGYYTTYIGAGAALSPVLFRDHAFTYLEVAVDGLALSPRDRIVSVGYAMQAQFAQEAAVAHSLAPGVEAGGEPVTRHVGSTVNVSFMAHRNALALPIAANSESKVSWGAEEFDTANAFDLVDERFNVPVDGYYRLTAQGLLDPPDPPKADPAYLAKLVIMKNSTNRLAVSVGRFRDGASLSLVTTRDVRLNAGDIIEIYVGHSCLSAATLGGNSYHTFFSGYLLHQ